MKLECIPHGLYLIALTSSACKKSDSLGCLGTEYAVTMRVLPASRVRMPVFTVSSLVTVPRLWINDAPG